MVRELEQAMAGIEALMRDMLAEKSSKERLEVAEDSRAELSHRRDAERQAEVGLRRQPAPLQDEVEQLLSRGETAQAWLEDWVLGSTEALEQLFVETGVDVEALLERAPTPQPRPRRPASRSQASIWSTGGRQLLTPSDPMQDNIERLSALQRLARSLPLGSPLDHFEPQQRLRQAARSVHAGLGVPCRPRFPRPSRLQDPGDGARPGGPCRTLPARTAKWWRSTTAWVSSPATGT